jgi:hypothetical protein
MAPPRPAPGSHDEVPQLKKLVEMRDLGLITTAEFEAKKPQLLGRM